jgi:hypothetical protein
MFPKPIRREREPQRLKQVSAKRAQRIAAGKERPGISRSRPGVHRKPGGTAHSRRPREFGRMKFARDTMACAVVLHNVPVPIPPGPCIGPLQYMHLGARKGYRAPDSEGAPGCAHHHQMIDNPDGFYLAMTEEERADFRARAIAEQKACWDSLTPEQREWWDEQAAIEFAKNRRGA